MILTSNTKILVVGLGVIGGGYAKALTDKGYRVSAITKEKADIDYAYKNGMIEYGTTEVEESLIRDSELIIFALYPTVFIDWIKKYQHLFTKGALITDVTGVKSSVVYEVQSILREDVEYISHHPMAGREKSGVEYSTPEVFQGANFIITPTMKNTESAKAVCYALAREIGFSKISELTPEAHDSMIAYLSQLTHAIAVTLMRANDAPELEKYTGDSFRDLTRIAKINDAMWSELFLLNKDALLSQMDAFIDSFMRLRGMLEADDKEGLRREMKAATMRRELFDKPMK